MSSGRRLDTVDGPGEHQPETKRCHPLGGSGPIPAPPVSSALAIEHQVGPRVARVFHRIHSRPDLPRTPTGDDYDEKIDVTVNTTSPIRHQSGGALVPDDSAESGALLGRW